MHFFKTKLPAEGEPVTVTFTNRTILRVLGLIILTILFLGAIRKAAPALVLVGVAVFLALALNAPVAWLAAHLPWRLRGSRSVATALIFVVIAGCLVGFLASLIPPLVHQSRALIDTAPSLVSQLRDQNSEVGSFIQQHHLQNKVQDFSNDLSGKLNDVAAASASSAARIGSSLVSLLTVLVLTYMMLIEGPRWIKLGIRLLPQRQHERAHKLAHAMYKVVRGYVNGQVLLAAIASILLLPGLFFLHIKYPLALMVLIFICGLIPMVGHTIGAIIVTIVALFTSLTSALIILLYYFLYQQIENYVVQPRLQSNSTNMSPLLVFVAVVIGASFSGLLGALVSIPIMGCLRILVLDWLERRNLLTRDQEKRLVRAETK